MEEEKVGDQERHGSVKLCVLHYREIFMIGKTKEDGKQALVSSKSRCETVNISVYNALYTNDCSNMDGTHMQTLLYYCRAQHQKENYICFCVRIEILIFTLLQYLSILLQQKGRHASIQLCQTNVKELLNPGSLACSAI